VLSQYISSPACDNSARHPVLRRVLECRAGTSCAAGARCRRRWRGDSAATRSGRADQPRVEGGPPPLGTAHPPHLRGRPARVPALRRADADHRVHHRAEGDRVDPQAPRGQGRRRAQPARRAHRHRCRLTVLHQSVSVSPLLSGSPEPSEAMPGRPAGQGFASVPGYLSHLLAVVFLTNST
jgi:hypothetical protein